MAMTLDGKVMRPDGKWYGLSSRKDKVRMDEYRSSAEILIVGKNSIINDDPVTHLRYVSSPNPRVVLLVRKGSIPPDRKIFKFYEKKPILFCTQENYDIIKSTHSEVSEIIRLSDSLPVEEILESIFRMGYRKILLEGGPTLNRIFLEKDCVTDLYLTLVPFLIGKEDLLSICRGESALDSFDQNKWDLTSVEKVENEVFLKYKRYRSSGRPAP